MTPQQSKYYERIKNDMLVVAAGQTISAVNKAAVVNKLLQVSCGSVYSEDGEVVEFDAMPRFNLLLEILAETNRKVIIFAMYRSSIDGIAAFLEKNGYNVGVIDGRVSATNRGSIINQFQNTPNPRC
jgi:SNF2 family DNA or RNA helicase